MSSVSAVDSLLFKDDFYPLDHGNWIVNNNGGEVSSTQDGLFLSSVNSHNFPFIYNNVNLIPESGNYTLIIDYSFPLTTEFGVGIGIGNLIPPYPLVNYADPSIERDFVYFDIWQGTNDRYLLQGKKCVTDTNCDSFRTNLFIKPWTNSFHRLKIKFIDNNFEIYHSDNGGLEEKIDNQVLLGVERRPTTIWFGNPFPLNNPHNWTSLNIRNIEIWGEATKYPVVVLPGFGGSWDMEAVLSGEPGTKWKIPDFVTNYQGVINSFKNAGYVEGTDLFVFAYDWRKPLDSLADDLKDFIASKSITTKINFVGHSMGGLVARSYAQKYGQDKVNKILTAGSPHMGLLDMYGLWEGATIWHKSWWQNALLEITTEVHKNAGETKVDSLRRNIPSVIDLFPTFPFLIFDGNLKQLVEMSQQNNYLANLNSNIGSLNDKLVAFWSEDILATKSTIAVTGRTSSDVSQNKWEDGRPLNTNQFTYTSGDGTVTKQSAIGPFTVSDKMTGWHGDLLASAENNKKILSTLGLDEAFAVSSPTDSRQNSFVALLRSPGIIQVCNGELTLCNEDLGGIYFPESKLFILPGYEQEDLVVKVIEDDFGPYDLYLGNIDETPDWVVREGVLTTEGQEDAYKIKSNGEDIFVEKDKANIDYTGTLFAFTPGATSPEATVKLSAKVTEVPDGIPGDLTLARVVFELSPIGGGALILVDDVPVSSAGLAIIVNYSVPIGDYLVRVYIDHQNEYWEDQVEGLGSLTVVAPSTDKKVTGGGWLPDQSSVNSKANFAFSVFYNKNGAPRGNFLLVWRGSDGFDYKIKSNSWSKGGLSFYSNSFALFTTKSTMQKIDRQTGEVYSFGGEYTVAAKISDAKPDTAFFTVYDSSNKVVKQLGPVAIGGGNISVNSK